MPTENSPAREARVGIIGAVQTPLGFFTLVVLVVEGILGILLGTTLSGTDRSTALYGMLSIFAALIIVVACFAVFRPEALAGVRQERTLEAELEQMRREAEQIRAEKDRLDTDLQKLQDQNRALRKANDLLTREVSSINSVRSRIWAILSAAGSADLSEILRDLGIRSAGPERDQVMGVLGALAEEGKIKRDTLAGGKYYMLTNT
jgi:hypothetical protein